MKSNQYGRFKIPEMMVRLHPDQVFEAFQIIRAVPVRAETLFVECVLIMRCEFRSGRLVTLISWKSITSLDDDDIIASTDLQD